MPSRPVGPDHGPTPVTSGEPSAPINHQRTALRGTQRVATSTAGRLSVGQGPMSNGLIRPHRPTDCYTCFNNLTVCERQKGNT